MKIHIQLFIVFCSIVTICLIGIIYLDTYWITTIVNAMYFRRTVVNVLEVNYLNNATTASFENYLSSALIEEDDYENETKYILDWNTFFGTPMEKGFQGKHFLEECPEFNCQILSNKSRINETSAVVFHATDINWNKLPLTRSSDQYYVFYSWEPPTRALVDAKVADGFFNLTMSYRLDSDLYSPYGDFKKISTKLGEEQFKQKEVAKIVRNKTKLIAWFVSNCNANSKRHLYVDELQKYVPIDVFGKCGQEVSCEYPNSNCYNCLYDYKFYLSFENSVCIGYVTEKLFNRINFFIVPIVLNKSLYQKPWPPKSIISATDFASVQQLAEYLHYLNNNMTAYTEYFEWRKNYIVIDNWINGCENPKKCAFCSLCTFLHRKKKVVKIKWDISKWWQMNTCDLNLVRRLLNETSTIHTW